MCLVNDHEIELGRGIELCKAESPAPFTSSHDICIVKERVGEDSLDVSSLDL